jgi:hypothetical protein
MAAPTQVVRGSQACPVHEASRGSCKSTVGPAVGKARLALRQTTSVPFTLPTAVTVNCPPFPSFG